MGHTLWAWWQEVRSPGFVGHQSCKSCGRRDKLNFYVPDEVWESVVPKRLRNRVVCLACFDGFAAGNGIPYATDIDEICFVGDAANLNFSLKRRLDV